MRPSRLLQSTTFRLSAIYAGLLVASFLVAAGGAWLATRSAAMNEAGERLERAYAGFAARLEDDGLESALRAMSRRSRGGAILWRLDGADGVPIGGDATLPSAALGLHMVDLPDDGAIDFPDTPDEPRGDHAVLTRELPVGGRLTLALDIQPSEIARDAVLDALLAAGAASVLAALAAGVWATRRALSRMDGLAEAARAFGAGELSARAVVRRASLTDDLDALAAAFNQMFERIDRLVAGVRRVSADVAHELRTPLTHVQQQLETARSALSLGPAQAAVEDAQTEVDALLRTFEAMLRLSEIEAGALRARFADCDLAATAETVCDAYRPDVEAGGRTLEARIAPGCVIHGDGALLAQATANLIENASRHTPPGTQIVVALTRSSDRISLSVSDDGPGIAAEHRARLLGPFERLEASRSTQGSGLGLSIVDAIVRLHGGELELGDASPGLAVVLTVPTRR